MPPAPAATAEYVVLAVGESVTLPLARLLVVTVRVEDPLVAVMVIEVALVVVQLRVVSWPTLTVVGVAVNCVI